MNKTFFDVLTIAIDMGRLQIEDYGLLRMHKRVFAFKIQGNFALFSSPTPIAVNQLVMFLFHQNEQVAKNLLNWVANSSELNNDDQNVAWKLVTRYDTNDPTKTSLRDWLAMHGYEYQS